MGSFHKFYFATDLLERGEFMCVDSESWKDIVGVVKTLEVKIEEGVDEDDADTVEAAPIEVPPTNSAGRSEVGQPSGDRGEASTSSSGGDPLPPIVPLRRLDVDHGSVPDTVSGPSDQHSGTSVAMSGSTQAEIWASTRKLFNPIGTPSRGAAQVTPGQADDLAVTQRLYDSPPTYPKDNATSTSPNRIHSQSDNESSSSQAIGRPAKRLRVRSSKVFALGSAHMDALLNQFTI